MKNLLKESHNTLTFYTSQIGTYDTGSTYVLKLISDLNDNYKFVNLNYSASTTDWVKFGITETSDSSTENLSAGSIALNSGFYRGLIFSGASYSAITASTSISEVYEERFNVKLVDPDSTDGTLGSSLIFTEEGSPYYAKAGGTITGNALILGNLSATTIYSGATELSSLLGSQTITVSGVTGLNELLNTKADISGSTFASSAHTHTISDVTNLQSSLNTKADLSGATFTGTIATRNIAPSSSLQYDLGNTGARYRFGFINNLTSSVVSGTTISGDSLYIKSPTSNTPTIAWSDYPNSGLFGQSGQIGFIVGANSANFLARATDNLFYKSLTFVDGVNIAVNTTTGTKIGTATTQKLAFWGATPISQPTSGTSINEVLSSTGLMQTGATSSLFSLPILATSISGTSFSLNNNLVLESASTTLTVGSGFSTINIGNASFSITGVGQKTLTHGGLTLQGTAVSAAGVSFSNTFGGSTSGDIYHQRINGSFSKSVSGTNYFGIDIFPTINQTGSANGTVTMIDLHPTITSVLTGNTIYGLRSQIAANPTGGGKGWNIYADGSAPSYFAGGISATTVTGTTINLNSTNPSTPSTGVTVYGTSKAGRGTLETIDTSGLAIPLQPALYGGGNIRWFVPASGTVPIGMTITAVGSSTTYPPISSTNLKSSMNRARYASSSATGSTAGIYTADNQCWRGNATGLGGWFFSARFGLNTNLSGQNAFVGLSNTSSLITSSDPSSVANTIGMYFDSTDSSSGNWKFIIRNTSISNITDLGSAAARNTTDVYDLFIYAKPNGTEIGVKIVNLSTNTVVLDQIFTNSPNAFPSGATFLKVHAGVGNMTAGGNVNIEINRIYLETPV